MVKLVKPIKEPLKRRKKWDADFVYNLININCTTLLIILVLINLS